MRIRRTIVLAALAAAGMFAQPVAEADAGHRWHMQYGWPFAERGYYAPRPRYYRYEPEYYDPYYGDDEVYDDPYYYEPPPRRKKRAQRFYEEPDYYEPPPKKKKKKLSTAKAYSNPEAEKSAPVKKKPQVSAIAPAKKPVSTVAPAKKPVTEVATASGGGSCDKAKTIIGNYGFASITPTDCEGSELGFKAQRDGKSFSIKVVDGELTEVKRQ